MYELDIKRHNFDMAVNRLKEFSEIEEAELAIDRVKTDGGFLNLGDHKVTGTELNNRLSTIQSHLIDINSTNNKTIKEFREIYNALDALDKDYIAGIVANVKAIEKTSNDVRRQQETLKQHNDKLATQQNKLDSHQVEIDKNVDNMKKIVMTLKSFKEKLDGYKHLTDIDKIWSDCKTICNDIQAVSDNITALSIKTANDIEIVNSKNKDLLAQVKKDIFAFQKEIKISMDILSDFIRKDVTKAEESIGNIENELQIINDTVHQMQNHSDGVDEFIAVMNGYIHLKDMDRMWEDLSALKKEAADLFKSVDNSSKVIQEHRSDLERINAVSEKHREELDNLSQNQNKAKEYAEANRNSIAELQAFRNEVDSVRHMADIDSMWEQGNEVKNGLAEANNHIVSLQEKTAGIDKVITDKTAEMQDKVVSLETKLKYAYYIAGGAFGLAAVEMLLALTGVI